MSHSRRSFLQQSSLLIGASAFSTPVWLKQLFAPAGEMKMLRRNVGIFTERGGTIAWMVDGSGTVVVDTQFPENANHLIDSLKEKGAQKVDLLINTHHHGDHSSGNIAFKGMVNQVVAHENSKANQKRVAVERESEDNQLYPDTTYQHLWSHSVGDETITLRHFGAAHTNGDSLVHFENANVVHCGDLMFNRRFPFIDRSAGASIENWITVLKKARKTFDKDTMYVFGHAGEGFDVVGTHKDLSAMQRFLSKLLKYTKQQIKQGKSLDQILATPPSVIPGATEWAGRGIERGLKSAYEELKEG